MVRRNSLKLLTFVYISIEEQRRNMIIINLLDSSQIISVNKILLWILSNHSLAGSELTTHRKIGQKRTLYKSRGNIRAYKQSVYQTISNLMNDFPWSIMPAARRTSLHTENATRHKTVHCAPSSFVRINRHLFLWLLQKILWKMFFKFC